MNKKNYKEEQFTSTAQAKAFMQALNMPVKKTSKLAKSNTTGKKK